MKAVNVVETGRSGTSVSFESKEEKGWRIGKDIESKRVKGGAKLRIILATITCHLLCLHRFMGFESLATIDVC